MIRIGLMLALVSSSVAVAADQLPDVDVTQPPPPRVVPEQPPAEDSWIRNRRLAAEFGFAEALTLGPIAVGLAGCELTRDGAGRCSIVFPLIAVAGALVGPPLGILLGADRYDSHGSPASAIAGSFLGLVAMLFPAVLLLSLPAFEREPARSVLLGALMSVFPVAGGMLTYELFLDRGGQTEVSVVASPTGLVARF